MKYLETRSCILRQLLDHEKLKHVFNFSTLHLFINANAEIVSCDIRVWKLESENLQKNEVLYI